MSCKYCENGENLIRKEFDTVPWWYRIGYTIEEDDRDKKDMGMFIDRGYLRLADLDDCQWHRS